MSSFDRYCFAEFPKTNECIMESPQSIWIECESQDRHYEYHPNLIFEEYGKCELPPNSIVISSIDYK